MPPAWAQWRRRRFNGRDSGQIDLLLRRSLDGGRSFGATQVVATQEGWTCGNPAPVVDRDTGVIWLLFCKNGQDDTEDLICQGRGSRPLLAGKTDAKTLFDEWQHRFQPQVAASAALYQ